MTDQARESRPSLWERMLPVDGRWAVVAIAAVVGALAAWRALLGMSFSDDGYYVAATVRLANGARLFVDEMTIQSTGFIAAVPFAKVWMWLFGTTGIVAALRLFYVALAFTASALLYRLLREPFGRWAAFAGAAVAFIAPAYNLLAVTYNTMAAAGLVFACVLCFVAVRESSRRYAIAAGVAAAIAAISYPPIVVASFVLLITLGVRTKSWRLPRAMMLGAAVVVAVFGAWLLVTINVTELVAAYDFVIGGWKRTAGPATGTRGELTLWNFIQAITHVWIVPLFVWFAPAAALSVGIAHYSQTPPEHRSAQFVRRRGLALVVLPALLLIPVVTHWFAHGANWVSLETIGGNLMIAFVFFTLPPMYMSLRGHRGDVRRDLVLMSLPTALTAYLIVVLFSMSDLFWASGIVGLAPLAVACVVWWATEIVDAFSVKVQLGAIIGLLLALMVLLFGYGFKVEGAPLGLNGSVDFGAFKGLMLSEHRAAQVEALSDLVDQTIAPSTTVLVMSYPGAYLITGGIPLTNAAWIEPGPSDIYTVEYLDRAGHWPDVVVMPIYRWEQPASVIGESPLLTILKRGYGVEVRSEAAGVVLLTRFAAKPIVTP